LRGGVRPSRSRKNNTRGYREKKKNFVRKNVGRVKGKKKDCAKERSADVSQRG